MFHKITPQNRASFLKALFAATIAITLNLVACSGVDGKDGIAGADGRDGRDGIAGLNGKDGIDGKDGKDAVVNVDSLSDAIRKQVVQSLNDSIKKQLTYDSSLQLQKITGTLYAKDLGVENVYGAFANHYSLMYQGITVISENGDSIIFQSPFPIGITDSCDNVNLKCIRKNILVKTWIPNFTDTATITETIIPNSDIALFPKLNFKEEALLALKSAQIAQRHIEAYVLDDDKQLLFYSESRPITIHPMQIFGSLEPAILTDSISKNYWYSVWVTPMADSISQIVREVVAKLPGGRLLVYQKYDLDQSVEQSSIRVVSAIFDVLQSRNIKYVQNTGAGSIGQRINYPVETLRKKQGLCIETAVLFASVLERLGYQTSLIITPDHAFTGWITEQNGDTIGLIETTMIADKSADAISAINYGIEEYNEQIKLGKFESGETVEVKINAARLLGITPNNIP